MCGSEVAARMGLWLALHFPASRSRCLKPRLPPESVRPLPVVQMLSGCVSLSPPPQCPLGMAGSITQSPFCCRSGLGELDRVSVSWDLVNYRSLSAHVSFTIVLAFIFLGFTLFCTCRTIALLTLPSFCPIPYFRLFKTRQKSHMHDFRSLVSSFRFTTKLRGS